MIRLCKSLDSIFNVQCRSYAIPLTLACITLAVYANSFFGVFQFDDYFVIVNYLPVHSLSAWVADIGHGLRPLLKLTYALNWMGFGSTVGFHAVNLAIHCCNVLLVYAVVTALIKSPRKLHELFLYSHPAALAAALFAVHPLHTEAVTYICGRSSSLATLLVLSSFILYVYGVKNRVPLVIAGLSPFMYCLAIATKESTLVFPLVLLLVERVVFKSSLGTIVRRQGVHWVLFAGIMMFMIINPSYYKLFYALVGEHTLYENLIRHSNSVCYLASRLVLVHTLTIDPDLPNSVVLTVETGFKCAVLAGILALALWQHKKHTLFYFGILWFFLFLFLPYAFVSRLDAINERQMYLADVGLFLAVGSGIDYCITKYPRIKTATRIVVCGLIFFLGVMSGLRNRDYHSEVALWKSASKVTPGKARVFNNLGYAYEKSFDYIQAMECYKKAIELRPDYYIAQRNLAHVMNMKSINSRTRQRE